MDKQRKKLNRSKSRGRPQLSEDGNSVIGAKVSNVYREKFIEIADKQFNLSHSQVLRALIMNFVDYNLTIERNHPSQLDITI